MPLILSHRFHNTMYHFNTSHKFHSNTYRLFHPINSTVLYIMCHKWRSHGIATKISSGVFNLAQNCLFTQLHDVKSKTAFACPLYFKLSDTNTKWMGRYSPDSMHKDNHENPAWIMMFWWLWSINTMVLLDLTPWSLVNGYQRFGQTCSRR